MFKFLKQIDIFGTAVPSLNMRGESKKYFSGWYANVKHSYAYYDYVCSA